jgi:hypothetical protein
MYLGKRRRPSRRSPRLPHAAVFTNLDMHVCVRAIGTLVSYNMSGKVERDWTGAISACLSVCACVHLCATVCDCVRLCSRAPVTNVRAHITGAYVSRYVFIAFCSYSFASCCFSSRRRLLFDLFPSALLFARAHSVTYTSVHFSSRMCSFYARG